MSSILFLIFSVAFSAIVAFYDFKYRQVPVWTLLFYTILLVSEAFCFTDARILIHTISYNLCFLAIQAAVLFLYYFLRYKSYVKLLNSIGAADIWLIIDISISFSTINFIVFMTVSLLLSLILFLVYLFVSKSKKQHIPLAGFIAAFYALSKIFVYFYKPHIQWDDTWIINKLGY